MKQTHSINDVKDAVKGAVEKALDSKYKTTTSYEGIRIDS
jgi:hypothetical protein